jgi:hypothetical protein
MHSAKRNAAILGLIAACTSCYSTQRIGPPETGNSERYAFVPVSVGMGVAGAAVSRAAGGCYAVCTYGTVCNPNTGACESAPEGAEPEGDGILLPFANFGTMDPGSPNDPRNTTPVDGDPPPIHHGLGNEREPVDACAQKCKLDEVCEHQKGDDDVVTIACVPKGPLPGDTN